MKQNIQDCLDCHRVCRETALYLQAEGKQAEAKHVQLLFDCAEICQASADFMAGDSDLLERFCGACSELCLRCAQECEHFEGDIQMKACANACRRCGESCRQSAINPIVAPGSRPEWIGSLADQHHTYFASIKGLPD